MRCIVAGGRDITDQHAVYGAIVRSGWMYEITEIVCGGATGVDDLGDKFAYEVGLPVRYLVVGEAGIYNRMHSLRNLVPLSPPKIGAYANLEVVADWLYDGHSAGPKRNALMANYAVPGGALVAAWDGRSPGTANMLRVAREYNLRHYAEVVDGKEG